MSGQVEIIVRDLKSMEKNAIKITGPIDVVAYDYINSTSVIGRFDPSDDLDEVDNCYREVNDIIAFVHGDAMYVIPACEIVRTMLRKNGFHTDSYLHVPFIWGEYPKSESKQWEMLKNWQSFQLEKDHILEEKRRKRNGGYRWKSIG